MAVINLQNIKLDKNIIKPEIKKSNVIDLKNIDKTWKQLENMGRIVDDQSHNSDLSWLTNYFFGQDVFVVGSGTSLRDFNFEILRNKNTIAINHICEYWDGFKWLIFLDKRFTDLTSFDLETFRNNGGVTFASNRTGYFVNNNNYVFKPNSVRSEITLNANDGLYCNMLSGTVALHLAIITGAKRIFLLGMDCGGGTPENFHFSNDYKGKSQSDDINLLKRKQKKYEETAAFFEKFVEYKNKIYNVSPDSNITCFQKITHKQMTDMIKGKPMKVEKKVKTICHIGNLPLESMGDITRVIIERCNNKQIYITNKQAIPNADVYVLHCFIAENNWYINFQKPKKDCKVVSIIHSSSKCFPALCSDKIITITNAQKEIVKKNGFDSIMIHAGIDYELYNIEMDYNQNTFGRLTRWSPGKVHSGFLDMTKEILNEVKGSECRVVTNALLQIPHNNFIQINDVQINEWERKVKELNKISIFVDCHNTFYETFSLCLLEAMASGCCIVLLKGKPIQSAMIEVLGNAGVICETIEEVKVKIKQLLKDKKLKEKYGMLAKERAKLFSNEKMVKKYNELWDSL